MTDPADRIIGLYDDKAEGWIADRGLALGGPGKSIDELEALERFCAALPPGASVLDVGCGSGWPWGAALIDRGYSVTGLDASARLIAHATQTLPSGEWMVGDMRTFDLQRTFDGLLVWYSLFHLKPEDQRTALRRMLNHASAASILMMTVPAEAGATVGVWRGEPLYHASLGAQGYAALLADEGFRRVGPDEPTKSERSGAWLYWRSQL
jgi:trans-aconitate methyltransferase